MSGPESLPAIAVPRRPFDDLDAAVRAIIEALGDEIVAARSGPGRSFEVSDGRVLHRGSGVCLYALRSDVSIPVAPETRVTLIVEGFDPIPGVVVSIEEFELTLELQEDLGDRIPEARIDAEPWFVLQALRRRLEAVFLGVPDAQQTEPTKAHEPSEPTEHSGVSGIPLAEPPNAELARALIGRVQVKAAGDTEAAADAAEALRELNEPSLSPNDGQLEAMSRCAGSSLHFVWGPPGTGKTACLAQVARMLVGRGEKVLMLAHANVAVDVAISRVADAFRGTQHLAEGRIMRLGAPQLAAVRDRLEILPEGIIERRQPDLVARKRTLERQRLELGRALRHRPSADSRRALVAELAGVRGEIVELDAELRIELAHAVSEAQVVAATLSRMTFDELVWEFGPDAVLVDETSMAGFPLVLAAATRVRTRLLLFGDFRQLPPVVLSRSELAQTWLARDGFELSGVRANLENGLTDDRVTMLTEQYRMPPPVASVVSELAYGGSLVTADGVEERTHGLAKRAPWRGSSVIVVDTSLLEPACLREPIAGSYSRANPLHALIAASVASRLVGETDGDAAVVTPYRAQARLLEAARRDLADGDRIAVATVHRFQGSERDSIVFDLVDAATEQQASRLTGADVETALRLVNVALSRPRGKLIVLANGRFIEERHAAVSPARRALQLLREYGDAVTITYKDLAQSAGTDLVRWLDAWRASAAALAFELDATQGRVTLNLPPEFVPPAELLEAIGRAAAGGREVVVFASTRVAEALEDTEADLRLMPRPGGLFALLDRTCAFVGGLSPAGPIGRCEGSRLIVALESLLLGKFRELPPPRAELDSAVDHVCGRCVACGGQRRPRQGSGGSWILRCSSTRHPSIDLAEETLSAIASAMGISCRECGRGAVARSGTRGVFLACPTKDCPGRVPSLEMLFG